MRTLIAWIATIAAGTSAVATASGQSMPAAPPTKRQAQPAAAKPTPGAAKAAPTPLDPETVKAQRLADKKAMEAMDPVLAEWEVQSKKIFSLQVVFQRIVTSRAWGNEYFMGQAILKSPDRACLEFRKWKVDADGKPLYKVDAKGQKVPDIEKEFSRRIVCNGTEVYQYEWDEKVVYVYPLDKEARQKALQEGPLPFLFNMKAAEAKSRYGMRLIKEDAKEFVIGVVPNEQIDKESFGQALIWLSKETYLPTMLRLYPIQANGAASKGETEEFIFEKNIFPNRPVPEELFAAAQKMAGWQIKRDPNQGRAPAPGPGPVRPAPGKQAAKPATPPR